MPISSSSSKSSSSSSSKSSSSSRSSSSSQSSSHSSASSSSSAGAAYCPCVVALTGIDGGVVISGAATFPHLCEYGGVKIGGYVVPVITDIAPIGGVILGGSAPLNIVEETFYGMLAIFPMQEATSPYVDLVSAYQGTTTQAPTPTDGVYCLDAQYFDGSEWIDLDTIPAQTFFTVSFWANVKECYTSRAFFSWGNLVIGTSFLNHLWVRVDDYDGFSNVTLNTERFYLLAVTWDGITLRLYINGVLQGSLIAPVVITEGAKVAKWINGALALADIQDLRIDSRIQSATYLRALYRNACHDGFYTVGGEVETAY